MYSPGAETQHEQVVDAGHLFIVEVAVSQIVSLRSRPSLRCLQAHIGYHR